MYMFVCKRISRQVEPGRLWRGHRARVSGSEKRTLQIPEPREPDRVQTGSDIRKQRQKETQTRPREPDGESTLKI